MNTMPVLDISRVLPRQETAAAPITTLEQVSLQWQQSAQALRTAALAGDLAGIIAAQNHLNAVPLLACGVLRARFVELAEDLRNLAERFNTAQGEAIRASAALIENIRNRGGISLEGQDKLVQDRRADFVKRLREHLDEILKAEARCRAYQGEIDGLLSRASSGAHVTGLEAPVRELGTHLREMEAHAVSWTAKLDELAASKRAQAA